MAKQLIARGQITVYTQNDAYNINQSLNEYIFTANNNGTIPNAVSFTSAIKVTLGDKNITNFTIGNITIPTGFSAITVNNTTKTITYLIAANTSNLADNGNISIPVIINNETYHLSFVWSKSKQGIVGSAGVDANLLDWVSDWDTNKTVISSQSVITPKIFAGIKNINGTITGTAIGRFPLDTMNPSGQITTETIDGIYGFKDGYKTFFVDNSGNAQLGRANQHIKYNADTGKVEFGSEISLNWLIPIQTAKNEAINTAVIDATQKIASIQIGTRNYIRNSTFEVSKISDVLKIEGVTAVIDTQEKYLGYNSIKITQNIATTENAAAYRVYFNALKLCSPASFSMWVKASATTSLCIRIGGKGTVDKAIDTEWRLIKLENITPNSLVVLFGVTNSGITYNIALPMLVEESLTLKVEKGKIGGWNIVSDSIYIGTKRNVYGIFTDEQGSITIGTNGIRGYKWRLDASGNGAIAGGNISWDKAGNITFAESVKLNWTSYTDNLITTNNKNILPKLTQITSTGIYTGALNASQITAGIISADRIAANSITSAKLDAVSIKANIINTDYINGLSCTFTKGTIGGWNIISDTIYQKTSGRYILFRATEGYSSVVSTYGKRGLTIYTEDQYLSEGAVKIVQMGMLADKNTAQTYSSTSSYGFRIMLKGSKDAFRADQYGVLLAGWNVDQESLYRGTKSNLSYTFTDAGASVTIGTRGIRGYKWRLESDGAGAIAGGNISWNTLGKVTFAESVSLNWTKYTDDKVNSINIGARNYALETSNAWTIYTDLANVFNQCILPYKVLTDTWKKNDTIIVTFDYKYSNIVANAGQNCEIAIQGSGNVTEWGIGGFNYTSFIDKIDFEKKSGTIRISYSFIVTADHLKNSFIM
ncbi:hypothetical protein [Dysgonomonas sp. 520]|uniref:hypothetical protein n=1 Tax=Dysgonomonas sp. 520 TaxID=2302931 RepID=UPI0013D01C42|nr:hypothetical protein [Dysgonomonas sp. 520]NDW08071.1 hypothetical protein [Dysgonomonas sp. 520]